MERILSKDAVKNIGQEIKVCGWVDCRRDHGKIIFIDLRDRWGKLQVVFAPDKESTLYQKAQQLRPEWTLEIIGLIKKRPKGMENTKSQTGNVEMEAKELKILSQAETLPFSIESDGYEINEEKRLKFRYLDLRRERLLKNLTVRQEIIHFIRNFMIKRGFIEIETPILTRSTPEGARDFLVPSRTQPGKFYALPQAPQQFKQILMAAGIERYFQIAKCFRDEDPRGDRQAEFTQLDLEMSFVKREDVMALLEELFIDLIKNVYPRKKIQEIPFPRISFQEAMKKYKTDRPDLRKNPRDKNELAFCWIIDFPFFEKDKENKWTFTHNPFSAAKPEFMDDLMAKKNIENILTTQFDIVLNGSEIGGGSIRNHQAKALQAVFEILGYRKGDMERKFGHFLKIFKYGLPPHGGIAPGIDRLVAVLENEPNIRETIAFPKTGDNRDLMMEAPSEIDERQLEELKIKITKTKRVKTKSKTKRAKKKN